jgi:hypothetical protein
VDPTTGDWRPLRKLTEADVDKVIADIDRALAAK